MITIKDKKDCCGCEACRQICPKHCIAMIPDSEGFRYPQVDASICIDCSLCEKVCPVINQGERPAEQPATFAAVNSDESIRSESSSGGMFSALAEKVIDAGGVVFGARFDDQWTVCHSFTETCEGLAAFRGSKYLQSRVGDSFAQVRDFLRAGRTVLFSGTPCQVAGLKRFLRKDYKNLILVDFVCHGVPSPLVWELYKESVLADAGASEMVSFGHISFRDKRNGWKNYGLRFDMKQTSGHGAEAGSKNLFLPFKNNKYMQVFLSDLSLRPSCYACPAKGFSSGADITLGDLWGIQRIDPKVDDDRGLSLVFVNTARGRELLDSCKGISIKEEPYREAVRYNPSVLSSVGLPVYRGYFFRKLIASGSFDKAYEAVFSSELSKRISRKLWQKFVRK